MQLVLTNVSLTYNNPYVNINCSQGNAKTLFALNGYPGIVAVAYNATAFQIPGTSNLAVPASVAADPTAACAFPEPRVHVCQGSVHCSLAGLFPVNSVLWRAAPGGINVTLSNVTAFCLERPPPSSGVTGSATATPHHLQQLTIFACIAWQRTRRSSCPGGLQMLMPLVRAAQGVISASASASALAWASLCCWQLSPAHCLSDDKGSPNPRLFPSLLR